MAVPSRADLEALIPPGVRAAVGMPGEGVEGFRATKRQADLARSLADATGAATTHAATTTRAAAATRGAAAASSAIRAAAASSATLAAAAAASATHGASTTHGAATTRGASSTGGALIVYRDVSLAAVMLRDRDAATSFLHEELGELARPTDAAAQLRRTLSAFYSCGQDRTRTAGLLGIHRNTVARRLNRIHLLVGHPLDERASELQAALALSEVIHTGSSEPPPALHLS
jgi:DNA-binding PucR family transcriptional regulator